MSTMPPLYTFIYEKKEKVAEVFLYLELEENLPISDTEKEDIYTVEIIDIL